MKIGIVTEVSYNICNYGNVLQAYALNKYLRDCYGCDVYTLELLLQRKTVTKPILYFLKEIKASVLQKRKEDRVFSNRKKESFKKFYDEQIPTIKIDEFEELYHSEIDAFIVGADVVWHQEHYFINALKFLNFPDEYNPIRISYAASFGRNWIPDENKKIIQKCLSKFKGISVREQKAQEMLEEIGIHAKYVLDPVFLIKGANWSIRGKMPQIKNLEVEKYGVVYLLNPQEYEINFIKEISESKRIRLIIISYTLTDYDSFKLPTDAYFFEAASPEEWIWLIEHSRIVLTDSFHAIAFSLMFNREFYAMNRGRMMDRILDILEKTGTKERLITCEYKKDSLYSQLNYDEINKYIESKRDYSVKFIDECLLMNFNE